MADIRIHIFGASGSGVSTLGRALGKAFTLPNYDFDYYYWEDTNPPYTVKRAPEDRKTALFEAIGEHTSFIVSGHYSGSYMCELDDMLTLAIFLYTPCDIRIERLKKRESADFGTRIEQNGDMYDGYNAFIDWASQYDASAKFGRSLEKHMHRIVNLTCPVLKLDGKKDTMSLVSIVQSYLTNEKE